MRGSVRRRLGALTVAAWLAATGLTGCRARPQPCVVTGVAVDLGQAAPPIEAIGLGRDDLRRTALEALGRTPGFRVPDGEPGKGARLCRGTITFEDARVAIVNGVQHAEVILRHDVAPGDDASAIGETVRSTEAVRPGEPLAAAFRRAVESGSLRAASAVGLALAEEAKPDADVIRDLESGDPRLRDLAVRVLSDRKNAAAVPALVARLQDPDPAVASRAVGALALIGDPRAVGPLIELSRRREGPFVVQMVRAVGDIGGAEAEAYLETLAAGHPDPQVAAAARDALLDAQRRKREGGAGR